MYFLCIYGRSLVYANAYIRVTVEVIIMACVNKYPNYYNNRQHSRDDVPVKPINLPFRSGLQLVEHERNIQDCYEIFA